jgi:hypothetical protein
MIRSKCIQFAHRAAFAAALALTAASYAATETARSADAFVDSIGINTHYGNGIFVGSNAYGDRRIDAKLGALGIRHIRDHSYNDTGVALVDSVNLTYGIRADLILGETTRSPADLVTLLKQHPAYESIEGLNEPDFSVRSYNGLTDVPSSNDYSATRAFQNDLYAAVKADPQTAGVTVLSPAMGRSNKSQYLVPIQFDTAAMHNYAWASPATVANEPSFGLDTALTDMATLRGAKPLMATETGYYTQPISNSKAVSESAQGKYMPRAYAEFFNRGIARTYAYELADQGPDTTVREQNFGLVRYDMTEKPAYTAMKNLIDLLKEPQAPAFVPASLDMTITSSGDLSKLHHTLLEKSDSTYYLMLWQEVVSYNSATKTEINNPLLPITLSLGESFAMAHTYLPNNSTTATGTYLNVSAINLSVPDQVLVVELSHVPEPTVVGIAAALSLLVLRRPTHRRQGA